MENICLNSFFFGSLRSFFFNKKNTKYAINKKNNQNQKKIMKLFLIKRNGILVESVDKSLVMKK